MAKGWIHGLFLIKIYKALDYTCLYVLKYIPEARGHTLKTSELLKLLNQNGIKLVRHGKRHDIYYSPITGIKFEVPRHKTEIKTGTLNSILSDAGLK